MTLTRAHWKSVAKATIRQKRGGHRDQRRSIQEDSRVTTDRNHATNAMMRQTSRAVPKGAPPGGWG